MIEHKWQAGDECKTRDGKPCRIVGYTHSGQLVWKYKIGESWFLSCEEMVSLESHNAPEPPTRKVVQRYYVDPSVGEVDRTYSAEIGQDVEWELDGDKIVGVRLLDGE